MTEQDFDKLPQIIQWALIAGGFLGGVLAYIIGKKSSVTTDDNQHVREMDKLQFKIDIENVRKDLELVMKANREAYAASIRSLDEAMQRDIAELENRLRACELTLARFEGRRSR